MPLKAYQNICRKMHVKSKLWAMLKWKIQVNGQLN
jgi:hypothetical protein